MGQHVLNVTITSDDLDTSLLSVYSHCARQGTGDVVILVANLGGNLATVRLPAHSDRRDWSLTADNLLSKSTLLNGVKLEASSDGVLPSINGQAMGGSNATS